MLKNPSDKRIAERFLRELKNYEGWNDIKELLKKLLLGAFIGILKEKLTDVEFLNYDEFKKIVLDSVENDYLRKKFSNIALHLRTRKIFRIP